MKAAVYERYGPPEVVEIRDVPKPAPAAGEVLIRVHATTVSAADWRLRSLELPRGFGPLARPMFGFRRPRKPILGTELSGVIEHVGADVMQWRVGDAVIAFPGFAMGAHAEYLTMPADGKIAAKPANVAFDQAAALCFGGLTALHFLRQAGVREGERVLVNGASGAVGVAAVQLARDMGARVTGVASGANEALVRSLGAERFIDYTREDFADGRETWDVIVDTAGTAPFARSRRALAPGGRLAIVLGTLGDMLRAPLQSLTSGLKVSGGAAPERAEDVRHLAQLAEQGRCRAVIDSRYPLERIVDAHRRVDSGHKRGSVVVLPFLDGASQAAKRDEQLASSD